MGLKYLIYTTKLTRCCFVMNIYRFCDINVTTYIQKHNYFLNIHVVLIKLRVIKPDAQIY